MNIGSGLIITLSRCVYVEERTDGGFDQSSDDVAMRSTPRKFIRKYEKQVEDVA